MTATIGSSNSILAPITSVILQTITVAPPDESLTSSAQSQVNQDTDLSTSVVLQTTVVTVPSSTRYVSTPSLIIFANITAASKLLLL